MDNQNNQPTNVNTNNEPTVTPVNNNAEVLDMDKFVNDEINYYVNELKEKE